MMPLQVPATTSSDTQAIKLLPGEEKRFDLRADVRRAYSVNLHLDPGGRSENRVFPTLTAQAADGNRIPLSILNQREQGEVRVSLPSGSHTIFGSMQNQEGLFEGQTQVTVTDHDVSGVILHLSRAANLPVVVEADSQASLENNAKLPDVNQLGLTLQATGEDLDGNGSSVRANVRKGGQPSFGVATGVYRLRGQAGGQWYVSAATCGGIDLLRENLPVSAGLDGIDVRVRVANNTATLSGKVTLSGLPGTAWVYLLATNPSATPVIILRSNADGSFFRPYLAPGGYRVVAFEQKVNADLQENATLSRFLDRVQAVTVTPGEQHTMTLDAVTERDASQ